jgi:hypothetical protein
MLFWLPMLWREAYPVDNTDGGAKGNGGTTVVVRSKGKHGLGDTPDPRRGIGRHKTGAVAKIVPREEKYKNLGQR